MHPETNDPQSSDDDASAIIKRLIETYDWRLLDAAVWQCAAQKLVDAQLSPNFQKAAVHVYSGVLYDACSDREKHERYERGFYEVSRYLYHIAVTLTHDTEQAQETTQMAAERIIRTIHACRHAGSFLAFAIQKLRDSIKAARRDDDRRPEPLDEDDDEGLSLYDSIADEKTPEPLAHLLDHERQAHFLACRDEFLRKNPRYTRHFATIWFKYVDGIDDDTIALWLGITKGHVQVLRHRVIERLKNDPDWQKCAKDKGMKLD